jgi:uncharacterized protein YceK
MRLRAFAVVPLAALALSAAGCGTLANQSEPGWLTAEPGHAPHQPYGGVGLDLKAARDLVSKTGGDDKTYDPYWNTVVGCCFLAVEFPLSAVADTLFLPFDAAYTLRRGDRDEWAEWRQRAGVPADQKAPD